MFKGGSIEDELMRSMEKELVGKQLEEKHGFNKLAKAIDYLNAAANIFEQAGLHKEAEEVTEILETMNPASEGDPASSSESFGDTVEEADQIFNKITGSDISSEDIKNIISSSPPGVIVSVLGKLYDVAKDVGDKGLFKTVKDEFKKIDLSDPESIEKIKKKYTDDLTSVIKGLKLVSKFI